ncbi:tetratricopeptide repeat protein [Laspinema olomoucense]|uniref:Tetratricopeptide repeat protein n=1 Tax=Laspinema olomoucense D3b TaxID=2953688 RepID=A0ABT2NET2_9CYAN|nr:MULTISPECIES: tetratricopeptide repeat protein [unclassified Laspinema]MCT7974313.1 tetratricopeptide repeat protein [Laspinema sp. D3d]MCT7981062.1 tetratricopeptide repeat protein [Laspinema sp. D3b]
MTEKKPRKPKKNTEKTSPSAAKSTKSTKTTKLTKAPKSDEDLPSQGLKGFKAGSLQEMEKMMRQIQKFLQENEFESSEAASAFLQEALTSGQPLTLTQEETPLDKAQDIMYEAWSVPGKKRVQLAKRALKISADCVDAYVLLAQESAKTLKEAKGFYEQGVQAGERALGPEFFEEHAGYFWGMTETRPYMRARQGLAECCLQLGETEEAIAHYQQMLRLNPNDNQGIRYMLLPCLLEEGASEAIAHLFQQYEDESSASWTYSRALWLFQKDGATEQTNQELQQALKRNQYVPDYLLGKKKMPKELPSLIGWGDESEAVSYAATALVAWHKTTGALEWLSATAAKSEGV